MAIPDRQLERFRVINGLAINDRLRPGDKVKIVVD
jgi:predicted Zn-dependent protease